MASTAFAVPILPGKTEEWKQFVGELSGSRKKEYEASRKRQGIKREYVYLQSTPMGDMAVIYTEADDFARTNQVAAASKDPFDVWFQQQLFAFHGSNLSEPGALASEAVLEWNTP